MTPRDKAFLKVLGVVLLSFLVLTPLLLPLLGYILFVLGIVMDGGFAP